MQLKRLLLLASLFLFNLGFVFQIMPQTNITQLSGGVITAQYSDSPSGEGITNLIDNSTTTKYLTFHQTGWIMFKSANAYIIKKYALSSANDFPGRDPKSWTLEASTDGTNWKTLDIRSDEAFADRYQRNEYAISNSTAYTYYKMTITCASGNTLQLSEWELLMDPLAHDVGVTTISAPVPHPLTAVTPKITVKNSGLNAESFPVTCTITLDGVQVYKQTVNASALTAGNSVILTFPDWTPAVDKMHMVTAYTQLSSDMLTYNDTLTAAVNTNKKMYMVGYAHLDLQWNWDLGTTINQYIPNTLKGNFALFDKYPDYKFTFEGAYRYMIMKNKYPADYAKLKTYVASGQWNVGGSMIEACDVIVPSPEALVRQILYGNNFFKEEFGKTSLDILLPDCFGFPNSLPTIAVHCGLKGFSTQKFDRWGGFRPSPFSIGRWEGVDGSKITTVLKPGAYDDDPAIREQDVNALGAQTGLYLGYDYYGTGDRGGAPSEAQVNAMFALNQNTKSDIKAVPASSDQIFRDLTDDQVAKLDTYSGELLMTRHGSGCYTSQADMKLLNRQNELMANAAERASVMADLFAGLTYPKETIKQSWITFLCHQFHDDLTGTSIPSAYDNYSLPDERASLASFTKIRNDANTAIAAKLNTSVDDASTTVPLVVYNPLSVNRYDICEGTVTFNGLLPKYVAVFDKDGKELPAQIKSISGQKVNILFMAEVPANGYSVFQVKKSSSPCSINTGMKVTANSLENKRYKVQIDDFGDISSIYDKNLAKELLQTSCGFEVRDNKSSNWPAWEVLYNDVTSSPRSYVMQGAQKTIIDSGAAQISIRVTRTNEGSNFTHYYILTADTAGYVKVDNTVDWKALDPNGSLLKVAFPLTASNSKTTYDLGIGTIDRGINVPELYEVPGQQWADITNSDKSFGVAVLNNCKYGWDKPADNIINLTLIHSPNSTNYNYRNDIFVHNFSYGIYGHPGNWADGNVVYAGERFNQPLQAFQATVHADGGLGKSFSFVSADPSKISVMAVKKAEYGEEYIIRVREAAGKNWNNVKLNFPGTVVSAKEVNGMEDFKGTIAYSPNSITFNITPYQPKTFSVVLKNSPNGINDENTLLSLYNLSQNYPNPFNPATVINYSIPVSGQVSLKVFDILGREVKTLVNEVKTAGRYSVHFNAQTLASGTYFYTLRAGNFTTTKKMTLIK